MPHDTYYERHLPHQVPPNMPIFLTWNLKGALTREMLDQIEAEQRRLEQLPPRSNETAATRSYRHEKQIFDFRDRLLGQATRGPMHLNDPRAAQEVVDSFLFGSTDRYDLFAFVVMGNHAHVLLTPRIKLSKVTQGIKGFTAWRINEIQNERDRTFWQDESYDHWARDEEEMLRIIAYIENNPVVAGLCAKPEDWPWSSAPMRTNWPVGQPYRGSVPQ